MSVYARAFPRIISRTDPEQAHHVALAAIAAAGRIPPARGLLRATIGHLDPDEGIGLASGMDARRPLASIGGRTVPGRLGLAAGMDKNAEAVVGMASLGFAFVEVGTVTPRPQPGNEAPRLWRLTESGGLRNRMGFNNAGAVAVAENLRRARSTRAGRAIVIGANIGKNKTTPESGAARDYFEVARQLAPWSDFVVVNVSSPNTPGLRDLQAAARLRPVLEAARRGCQASVADRRVPLMVKIAPDLPEAGIVEICALARDLGLEGVVATNTTTNHHLGEGGVSGQPLFERALDVVTLVGEHLDDSQVLIASGGIATPRQARLMLDAGADLLEAFTAFIYEGPTWPGRMNRTLLED